MSRRFLLFAAVLFGAARADASLPSAALIASSSSALPFAGGADTTAHLLVGDAHRSFTLGASLPAAPLRVEPPLPLELLQAVVLPERPGNAQRHLNHARYFSSYQGRFLGPDFLHGKVEDPQSWNRYAYVAGNPLKFVDLDGNDKSLFQAAREFVRDLFTPTGNVQRASSERAQTLHEAGLSGSEIDRMSNRGSRMGAELADSAGIAAGVAAEAGSLYAQGKVGQVVLGHFPAYVEKANELGARRFNIPAQVWGKMSAAEQWAANQKFLDRLIARGDVVTLATPLSEMRPGSWFAKEVEYLLAHGYQLTEDAKRLVPVAP